MAQKSREEGEIGSESREKGDLPPVPHLLLLFGRDRLVENPDASVARVAETLKF